MNTDVKHDRRVSLALGGASLSVVVAVALYNPGLLSFRAFGPAEFVGQMLPLVMVALFIERALEVFLTSWKTRQPEQPEGSDRHNTGTLTHTHTRSRTRRLAFFAGFTLGVIVAALGIRVLEMFVDPAAFGALSDTQQRLFRTTDVLLTGAVLGGGSDALHQLVLVFTNFFERAKGRGEGGE